MQKLKIGILISGGGSNMHSIIRATKAPNFPCEVVQVICNNPDAKGIEIAKDYGIKVDVVNHRDFDSRPNFEAKMHDILTEANVELLCYAGFMRIVSESFAANWEGRAINIHPSLLPCFKGLHTHMRALETGVKIAGCTVHYVTAELDDGPIIAQAAVPVLSDDDEKALASRVLEAEHQLYPHAIRMIAEKRSYLDGKFVKLKNDMIAEPSLFSPTLHMQ